MIMKLPTITVLVGAAAVVVADDVADPNEGYEQALTNTSDFDATSDTYITKWSTVDCVAQDAFNTCTSNLTTTQQNCIDTCPAKSEDDDNDDRSQCIAACKYALNLGTMNCALEYCWNHVYGCDYQKNAMNLISIYETSDYDVDEDKSEESDGTSLSYLKLRGIPYFPAPVDAPGACSCNIASASSVANDEVWAAYDRCGGDPNQTSDLNQYCSCCGWSGATSAFYAICPTTDPAAIQLNATFYGLIAPNNYSYSTCDDALASTSCTDIDFPALPNNASFLRFADLPIATDPLSDLSGQVTSPASGWSPITWSLNGTTYTVTPTSTTVKAQASITGKSAASSGSAASGSSASGGATASKTSSGLAGHRTGVAAGAAVVGLAAMVVAL